VSIFGDMCYDPWSMADWVPEVAYADADVAIGHAGPVIALFWRGQVRANALQRLQLLVAERSADAPLVMFRIVEAGAVLPERDTRALGAAFFESVGDLIAVSAFVVEGPPMQAAAFRGLDAGLAVLAKRDYPHSVFESLSEAAGWVAERAPERWHFTGESLAATLGELRRLSPR